MTTEELLARKYTIELREDEDGGGYFASDADLPGCMAQGDTPQEAIDALKTARELWIETAVEDGQPVPAPLPREPSGKILVRTSPGFHHRLARHAQRKGVSLNFAVNELLHEALEARNIEECVDSVKKLCAVVLSGASAVFDANFTQQSAPLSTPQRAIAALDRPSYAAKPATIWSDDQRSLEAASQENAVTPWLASA